MRLISAGFVTVQVIGIALILPLPRIAAAGPDATLVLTSSAFENGGTIPVRYTGSGHNTSPPLEWTSVPNRTRSLALILDDPDAPMGTFVHWVVYNLPPAAKGLIEGVSESASAVHGEEGVNGRSSQGYTGPCPPPGTPHHYHFRLFALDKKLELKPGATAQQVEAATKEHVLERTELVGTFNR